MPRGPRGRGREPAHGHLSEDSLGVVTRVCLLLVSRRLLSFDSLLTTCLRVGLSVPTLLGVYRASWMCG